MCYKIAMSQLAYKVMTLKEATERLVQPGCTIALGCALEGFEPFAAAHEIIRRGAGDLTLIGPISNIIFDQIIASGVVSRVIAAWVGNVSTGIGYNYRRAVEEGVPVPLELIRHSNFSITLALEAGARGLPMAVSRSPLGSDIAENSPHFKMITCPHSGEKLLSVKAVNPDLTVLHVQKADVYGNALAWGAIGNSRLAAYASRDVLITCEEIVEPEEIRGDPDRVLIPGFVTSAVCEVPWGAHPAPVQGYYDLDGPYFLEYAAATRQREDALAWLDEWVYGVKNHSEYLAKVGRARWSDLRVKNPRPSQPVDYGW